MTTALEETFTIAQTNEMFKALIMELDLNMGELMDLRAQGEYVKLADAMDIFLEFRNSLSGMVFEE